VLYSLVCLTLCSGLPDDLVRGMKEKKLLEVAPLAALIDSVARSCGATMVVDCGSGHGHLARVLAYRYGLHVVGLDCSEYHAHQAQLKTVGGGSGFACLLLTAAVHPQDRLNPPKCGSVRFVQQRITKNTTAADVVALLLEQSRYGVKDDVDWGFCLF
jgi:hypothetical protein